MLEPQVDILKQLRLPFPFGQFYIDGYTKHSS